MMQICTASSDMRKTNTDKRSGLCTAHAPKNRKVQLKFQINHCFLEWMFAAGGM